MAYILITGNPVDGFEYIGPFATAEDAGEHANTDGNIEEGDWWIATIESPEQAKSNEEIPGEPDLYMKAWNLHLDHDRIRQLARAAVSKGSNLSVEEAEIVLRNIILRKAMELQNGGQPITFESLFDDLELPTSPTEEP